MLTVVFLLALAAFVSVLVHALLGTFPLWVPVLLLCVLDLILLCALHVIAALR
jgi:hypothetical protein